MCKYCSASMNNSIRNHQIVLRWIELKPSYLISAPPPPGLRRVSFFSLLFCCSVIEVNVPHSVVYNFMLKRNKLHVIIPPWAAQLALNESLHILHDQGNLLTYIFHIPRRVGHGVDGQIDNTGNGNYYNKCWWDVTPTNPPVHMRPEAKHILNVIFKPVCLNKKCTWTLPFQFPREIVEAQNNWYSKWLKSRSKENSFEFQIKGSLN